jgi:hypothetical protein
MAHNQGAALVGKFDKHSMEIFGNIGGGAMNPLLQRINRLLKRGKNAQ